MDLKKHLKNYMMNYPDSFVGFFWATAEILKELGQEWISHGKKEWGDVFISSGNTILEIAANLSTVNNEYKQEQLREYDIPKIVEEIENV